MRSIERAFEGKTMMAVQIGAVRLTRRGRLVLVMTVMLALVIAGLTLGHGSSLAAGRTHSTPHTVVVEPGETLWSVATRIAPHDDPRLVVADIETMNHLATPAIEAGEQLVVPTIG